MNNIQKSENLSDKNPQIGQEDSPEANKRQRPLTGQMRTEEKGGRKGYNELPDSKDDNIQGEIEMNSYYNRNIIAKSEQKIIEEGNRFLSQREKQIKEQHLLKNTAKIIRSKSVMLTKSKYDRNQLQNLNGQEKYNFFQGKKKGDVQFGDDDFEDESFDEKDIELFTKKKKEVKMQAIRIQLDKQKRKGILPHQFTTNDVDISFTLDNNQELGDQDSEVDYQVEDGNFAQYLVISHNNKVVYVWNVLYVLSCLTSCYFYAFMAAFEKPKPGSWLFILDWSFEGIFLISMLLNFITDYKEDGNPNPVRDLNKISMRYLKGQFAYDIIPLIPLPHLPFGNSMKHFYLIKIMRMVTGIRVFDVSVIMSRIKLLMQKKLEYVIANDPIAAEDQDSDQNKIAFLIKTNFFIRIFKLVIIIMNISYFIGFFWYIFCDVTKDVQFSTPSSKDDATHNFDNFIEAFELVEYKVNWDEENKHRSLIKVTDLKSDGERAIISMYFAFTTLSTVGFGDYYPKSDVERLVGGFVMLFGVAIFSYIMGKFIEILEKYQALNADLDQGDQLSKFFGMIKRFNGDVPLRLDLKQEIEEYFSYRWEFDRNQAIDDEEENAILEQLPSEVQNRIYNEFLFQKFVHQFVEIFRIPKQYNIDRMKKEEKDADIKTPTSKDRIRKSLPMKDRFYNWEDQPYREFMMAILLKLEPRFCKADTILFYELQEIQEVLFVQKGFIEVGFEINRQKKFVIRFANKVIIGAYNCSVNKKTLFVYKCKTDVSGYMLRKQTWQELMKDHGDISEYFRQKVEEQYMQNIYNRVRREKEKYLDKLKKRADQQNFLMLIAKDEPAEQEPNDVYAKSSVGRSSLRSKSIQKQINEAMDNEEEKELSNKDNKTPFGVGNPPAEDDSDYQGYQENLFEQGILKYNQKVTSILKNIEKQLQNREKLMNALEVHKRELELMDD